MASCLEALVQAKDIFGWLASPFAGYGLAVLLIPVSVWVGNYINRRRLVYVWENTELISDSINQGMPGQVEVTVAGKKVKDLSRADITIWNAGKKTIRASEVVTPITVEKEGPGGFLSATLIKRSIKENGASANLATANLATFSFDYLDPGQGFVVSLLYSGKLGSQDGLGTAISSVIQELPKGLEHAGANHHRRVGIQLLCGILPIFIGFLIGTGYITEIMTVTDPSLYRGLHFAILLGIPLFMPLYLYSGLILRFLFQPRIPRALIGPGDRIEKAKGRPVSPDDPDSVFRSAVSYPPNSLVEKNARMIRAVGARIEKEKSGNIRTTDDNARKGG